MLKADSRTLKRERDVHSKAAPPTIQSAVAWSCTVCTRSTMRLMGVPGSACLISLTRNDDSSARPVNPSSARDRKVSGTKESSAKYAIIAARCGPRSAKNLRTRSHLRTRMPREYRANGRGGRRTPYASWIVDAQQALADLTEISSQIQAAVVFDGA